MLNAYHFGNMVTGPDLKNWREKEGMSLRDLGQKIGGVSASTVGRWESGDQEIPGPVQLLLKMLVHGEVPFVEGKRDLEREAKHLWQLQLTLDDWHVLEGKAFQAGFTDTKDYILYLIQDDLRTTRQGKVTDDDADEGVTSDQHLEAAAKAFLLEQGQVPQSQAAPPVPGSGNGQPQKG